MKTRNVTMGIALLVAGCQAAPDPQAASSAAIQITETSTGLTATALSTAGTRIELTLQLGTFKLPDEDRMVDGRRLAVRAGNSGWSEHVSEGRSLLFLPLPGNATLDTFLAEPQLAEALARWNVTFDLSGLSSTPRQPTTPAGEQAYQAACHGNGGTNYYLYTDDGNYDYNSDCGSGLGNCTVARSGSCGSTSDCEQFTLVGEEGFGEYVCCNASSVFVSRWCTLPNSTNRCGAAGPNGCSICWSQHYDNGCCGLGGWGEGGCNAAIWTGLQ